MINQTLVNVDQRFAASKAKEDQVELGESKDESARKARKQPNTSPTASGAEAQLHKAWKQFTAVFHRFEKQVNQSKSSFAFWFAEGSLVKAIKEGHWILLDEVNLASSETLERLSGVLEGESASLSLTERGDSAQLVRHPDFRLFAAMNPPTDFGKKDLPPAIRLVSS